MKIPEWMRAIAFFAVYAVAPIMITLAMVMFIVAGTKDACAGPFVGGGLGYTPLTKDDPRCNEFCSRDEKIATVYAGYRWNITDNLTHELRGQHYSVPQLYDRGIEFYTWTVEYEW